MLKKTEEIFREIDLKLTILQEFEETIYNWKLDGNWDTFVKAIMSLPEKITKSLLTKYEIKEKRK